MVEKIFYNAQELKRKNINSEVNDGGQTEKLTHKIGLNKSNQVIRPVVCFVKICLSYGKMYQNFVRLQKFPENG